MSWAHNGRGNEEWNAFVADNASGGGELFRQNYLRAHGKLLADTDGRRIIPLWPKG